MLQLMQSFKQKGYGILGEIVKEIYEFLRSGKDPQFVIKDPVNIKEVLAKDYFLDFEFITAVNRKNLPFDIHVKGIYIDKKDESPHLQLSELDFSYLEKELNENPSNDFRLKGKSIFYNDTKLIKTSTYSPWVSGERSKRSSLKLIPKHNENENLERAIEVVDIIYENNAFKLNSENEKKLDELIGSISLVPELKQKQILEMQGMMDDEQILTMMPQRNIYQEVRADILQAPSKDLENFEKWYTAYLRKKVIRKLINGNPNLTWIKANEILSKIERTAQ